jgi:hypothetical protein
MVPVDDNDNNNNNKLYLYHGQRGNMTVHTHTFAHARSFLPLNLVSLVRLMALPLPFSWWHYLSAASSSSMIDAGMQAVQNLLSKLMRPSR